MRVDERQVERSLAALRAEKAAGRHAARPRPWAVPSGLVERLTAAPDLRHDLIRRARAQLDDGDQPSPAALARHVVGRLVCERLR
jgi:hypothetical protein